MPNYRYNSPDYMNRGRNGCTRQNSQMPMQTRETAVNTRMNECCDDRTQYDELRGMPLAMAYVPWQEWRALYEAEKGFCAGTIFAELDKPFQGTGGRLR